MHVWGSGKDLVATGRWEPPTVDEVAHGVELSLPACGGDRAAAEAVVSGLLGMVPAGNSRALLLALMRGLSDAAACGVAGIGRATLARTCAEHEAFALAVEAARNIGAARLESVLEQAAARGEFRAAAHLLRIRANGAKHVSVPERDPWEAVLAGWRPAEVIPAEASQSRASAPAIPGPSGAATAAERAD